MIGFADVINPIPIQARPTIEPSSTAEYYGRQLGGGIGVTISAVETVTGGILAGLGGGAEVASVGIATPVAVPVTVAGVAMTSHGLVGINNFVNMKRGGPSPSSSSGKSSSNGSGRVGKQERLNELSNDPNVSSKDRGWIKQEKTSIERGKRDTIRVPPGKEMAHERGREAAKGYNYKNSNLQDKDLHKLQHKYDDFGRKNKERPIIESTENP